MWITSTIFPSFSKTTAPALINVTDVDGAVGTKSQSSLSGSRPGFDEFAVLIKDANALVAAIRNKETTTGINGHGMRKVKFARPASFDAADDPDELSLLRELDDSRIDVPVRHKDFAVLAKGDSIRTVERLL